MSEFHNLPFARDFGSVFRHIADAANKGESIFKRINLPGLPVILITPEGNLDIPPDIYERF